MEFKLPQMLTPRWALILLAVTVSSFGSISRAETATGSGFFISANGHFITNQHVIDGADEVRIRTNDGRTYRARVIKAEAGTDLALLKVDEGQFRPLSITNSVGIRRGENVYTLGFPQIQIQGLEPKLTEGTISSLSGIGDDPKSFQISNPIQAGNSGGPLFTEEGQIVGVVRSSLSASYMQKTYGTIPQNVNYAIKSSLLLEFLAGHNIDANSKPNIASRKKTEMIAQVEQSIGLVIASTNTLASTGREEKRDSDRHPPAPTLPTSSIKYPERPISFVVPVAQGSGTDAIARRLAETLSRTLNVSINVRNILGDGGVLGTQEVMQSGRDGYTVLFHGTTIISKSLASGSNDDWLFRDLTPVGMALEIPLVIIAATNTKIRNLNTLRSSINDRNLSEFAHSGDGSIGHLCALMVNSRLLQGKASLVAYKGTAPALVSVISGISPVMCDTTSNLTPNIQSRKVTGVVIASGERVSSIYDVPTLLEEGSESLISNWNGLFVPRGTPEPIVRKLSQALQIALRDPSLREGITKIAGIAASPDQASPEFLAALVRKDYARYRPFFNR
jgi:tripartite-type tricarboxylate transporter receptor subunit TctC